jgi:hypothetical protein
MSGPKKAQFTHERVEYNVILFDEPPKSSKSLKIFKSCDIYHRRNFSNSECRTKIDIYATREHDFSQVDVVIHRRPLARGL